MMDDTLILSGYVIAKFLRFCIRRHREYLNLSFRLCDKVLNKEYLQTKSMRAQEKILEKLLKKYNINNNLLLNDILIHHVKPSVKAVVRGLKFNTIVKNYIINIRISPDCIVCFEKSVENNPIVNKPDWFIMKNGKYLIGYNQIDLFNGGHQLDRGNLYVVENNNTDNMRYINVVAFEPKMSKRESKAQRIYNIGFSKKNICLLHNLRSIIEDFLDTR